jgi:hypothetical protein
VVKFDTLLAAKALPASVSASVVTVTVYSVKAKKVSVGVNVAVVPVYVTVPGTTVLPCLTITVEELMVAGFMASLNDIVMELLRGTLVALLLGLVVLTVGAATGLLSSSFEQPEMSRRKTIENTDSS